MNGKFCTSFNAQQDTLKLLKSSSDSIAIIRKDSTLPIQPNTFKPLIIQPKQNVVNQNQQKDSAKNQPLFLIHKSNDKSLIDNYKEFISFSPHTDSNCYIIKNQIYKKAKPVFVIDKNDSKSHVIKECEIKEKIGISNDWTLIPILLGMLLFASIVVRYRKYLGILFESIIYRLSSNKILNEKNTQVKRLTIILDAIYIIAFSLTIDQVVKGLEVFSPPPKFPFIVFVVFFAFLVILRIFRLIVFKLSAIFSGQRVFFKDLFNSSLLYTRTLGLFLLPLVFFVTYSTGTINLILIYLSVFIIFIMLIMRLISMFRAFIVVGFSIFYFILYLCALEILPLLVIWKEVNSR